MPILVVYAYSLRYISRQSRALAALKQKKTDADDFKFPNVLLRRAVKLQDKSSEFGVGKGYSKAGGGNRNYRHRPNEMQEGERAWERIPR